MLQFVNGHDLLVDGGIAAGRPESARKSSWRPFPERFGPNIRTGAAAERAHHRSRCG
jgi:hypothetical protein